MRTTFIKFVAKTIVMTASLAIIISTIGCGKTGSSSNNNPYWWNTGIVGLNGVGAGGGIAAAGEETDGRAMVILNIANGTGGVPVSGPVIVTGQMRVNTPILCLTGAALPPDVYQIAPYQNTAILNGSMISNATLVATGSTTGVQVLLTVPFANVFTNTNVCGFPGLTGEMNIVSVGGYQCQYLAGITSAVPVACQ